MILQSHRFANFEQPVPSIEAAEFACCFQGLHRVLVIVARQFVDLPIDVGDNPLLVLEVVDNRLEPGSQFVCLDCSSI